MFMNFKGKVGTKADERYGLGRINNLWSQPPDDWFLDNTFNSHKIVIELLNPTNMLTGLAYSKPDTK